MPSGVIVYDLAISPVNTVLSSGDIATFSITPQSGSFIPSSSVTVITSAILSLTEAETYGIGCYLQLGDHGTTANIPYDPNLPSKSRSLLAQLVPDFLAIASEGSVSVTVRGGSVNFRSASGILTIECSYTQVDGGEDDNDPAPTDNNRYTLQYFNGTGWEKATCFAYVGDGHWQECAVFYYTGGDPPWAPCCAP